MAPPQPRRGSAIMWPNVDLDNIFARRRGSPARLRRPSVPPRPFRFYSMKVQACDRESRRRVIIIEPESKAQLCGRAAQVQNPGTQHAAEELTVGGRGYR